MSLIEIQKRILSEIGLYVKDDGTILDIKKSIKTLVTCNKKLFTTNDTLVLQGNKYTQLNLMSKKYSCTSSLIQKHVQYTLSSKLELLFSSLMKFVSNPEYHTEDTQELNQLVFKLLKITNSSVEDIIPLKTVEKLSSIFKIIKKQVADDALIKITPKIEYVVVEDKKVLSRYKKIYTAKNKEVVFTQQELLNTVSFPLYETLKATNDSKLLGVDMEDTELKILQEIYKFTFKDINNANDFRFPEKVLFNEYHKNNTEIYNVLIDNTLVSQPLMMLKIFIKMANHIDNLLEQLPFIDKSKMFNLTITEEILEQFENDNFLSIDLENNRDLINESRFSDIVSFKSLNKSLNEKSVFHTKISLTETLKKAKNKQKKVTNFKKSKQSSFFPSMQSSLLSLPSFNMDSKILDPTEDSYEELIPYKETLKGGEIIGATGSGKTEIVKNSIYSVIKKKNSSVIVIEPHGDLSKDIALMLKDKERLVYIDAYAKKGKIPTVNPFELKDKSEENISIVTQGLVEAFRLGLDLQWSPNMEAVLVPCISTLLRKGDSDIYELQRFMNNGLNDDLVELGKESPIKGHREFFKNQFCNEKLDVTKDALETKFQNMLNDPVLSNLISGKTTIDLEKIINTVGKVVVIKLSKNKMKSTLGLYSRLMMATIQSVILKREDQDINLRPQTFLYLDEAQNFISPTINDIFTESRKYGLSATLSHQNIDQLDKKIKSIILSNANIKIVGKCSHDDLKIMSKEIQVDLKEMKDLNVGEFFLKVGNKPAVKIMNTDKLLGSKSAVIDDNEWQEHLQYQLDNYYRDVEDETLPIKISNAKFKETLDAEIIEAETTLTPYIDEF